jgi:pimeloyl-ACP methyl ester carboxylesterase
MKIQGVLIYIMMVVIVAMIVGCRQHYVSEKINITKVNEANQFLKDKDSVPSFISGYSPVHGINMYYEIHGTGKPLVLIHGGGSTIQTTFGRILPVLAGKRQVIAVELQAHGHTEDRNTPLSFEQDADDVALLLKNLNISKTDFLGFSNGGNTAMQIAIRHPEIVNKLIIASSFYKRNGIIPQLFDGLKKATLNDMPAQLKKAYLQDVPDTAGLKKMFEKDKARMVSFKDWSDKDIKSITAPALLILGDADMILPEHAVAMSHLIPKCRLAIIPGGHGKYLGEITTLTDGKWTQDYVTPLIEQFLDASDN